MRGKISFGISVGGGMVVSGGRGMVKYFRQGSWRARRESVTADPRRLLVSPASNCKMPCEIWSTALEDKPPTRNKMGAVEDSIIFGVRGGGACNTTWPVVPPSPELDKDIIGLPDGERQPSGMGSMGTTILKTSQLIVEAGLKKLTVGGMSLCSNIRHALTRDARKAATSKWLTGGQ
jgi:hypothetical protein